MYQHVEIIGRLGKDPESRQVNGTTVTNMSIAVDFVTGKGEDRKKQTEWFRVELWRAHAEVARDHLRKGDLAHFSGRLLTSNFEDREGNKRSVTKLVCDSFDMLGGGKSRDSKHPEGDSDLPY